MKRDSLKNLQSAMKANSSVKSNPSAKNSSTVDSGGAAQRPVRRIGLGDPRSPEERRSAYFRHHRLEFVNSWLQLWLTPVATFLSICVMGMALCLPITLWVLIGNVKNVAGFWDDGAQVTVYLKPSVTDMQSQVLARQVQDLPEVASMTLISKEQGLQQLQEAMGVNRLGIEGNPLPVAIRIEPTGLEDQTVAKLQQQLSAWPEVDDVVWDQTWFQRLTAAVDFFDRILFVFLFGLATLIVLVVLTATRLAIYHRSSETKVLRLFGASDAYIRRPFLYAGAWLGFWAGVVALVLASFASQWLAVPAVSLLQSYLGAEPFQSLTGGMALQTLVLSVGLAWLGAWIATQHYLAKS